jgi:hypothetical protein
MDYKTGLIIGAEILVAIAAGVATFIGAKHVLSDNTRKELEEKSLKPSLRDCPRTEEGDIPEEYLQMSNTDPEDSNNKLVKIATELSKSNEAPPSAGVVAVSRLKKIQGLVEKVSTVIKSLTSVIETTVRIFDKKSASYLGAPPNVGPQPQRCPPDYNSGRTYGFYNPYQKSYQQFMPQQPEQPNNYNACGYGGYTSFGNTENNRIVESAPVPGAKYDGDPYGYGTPECPGPLSEEAKYNVMMRIPVGETVKFRDGSRIKRTGTNMFDTL